MFKAYLHSYLRGARETLLWKLDGLGEHDIRRPLTPPAPTSTSSSPQAGPTVGPDVSLFGEMALVPKRHQTVGSQRPLALEETVEP